MQSIITYGGVKNIPFYNCSTLSPQEWSMQHGEVQIANGIISLLYGIIILLLYIPCLYVMTYKSNYRMPSYKIMFFLGLLDIGAIIVNSLITGVLLVEGAVYCSYPTLIFIAGSMGLGLWCSTCMVCITLLINRLLDLWRPFIAFRYFGGQRTYIWLTVAFFYGLYFILFTSPVLFNSKYQSWFFDPFIDSDMSLKYQNEAHTFNNSVIVMLMCFLYAIFYKTLERLFRNRKVSESNRNQMIVFEIFIQSTIICVINFFGSILFIVMQFFAVPLFVIRIAHCAWQLTHGCPPLIYLLINRNIRGSVFQMFRNCIPTSRQKPYSNTVPHKAVSSISLHL